MRFFFLLATALLFLFSSSLNAQSTGLSGFDLRLFRPPADGQGLLNIHGSSTLAPRQLHWGLVGEWSHGLLGVTNDATGQFVRVVDDLFVLNAQGALGITSFMDVGVTVPVIPFEKGANLNTLQTFETASLGDIAVDLKFQFVEGTELRPGLALISQTTFPSGDEKKFTGYANVTQEGRLVADQRVGPIYFATNIGYRAVPRTAVAGLEWDDLLIYGGGISFTPPFWNHSTDLLGELDSTMIFRDRRELTSPMEWLTGVRKKFDGFTLQAAGGRGITNGVGGGEWRVIGSIGFTASAPGTRVLFQETIPFAFDKRTFLPRHRPDLDQASQVLQSERRSRVRIRGHSDSEGTAEYNRKLSQDRAETVAETLRRLGIIPSRISTEAVGEIEPAADNRTKEGKSKNRRVEIIVVR